MSWSTQVAVKPRTDYRLTGWIKTENVRKVGGANGAMLNVHELQDPVRGGTQALLGDNDWTQVQLNFNSGEREQMTINCLFGGWGRTTGTAWFDDIELIPAPGSELAGEIGRVGRGFVEIDRQAKVDQHRRTIVRADEHVGRLDIAMDEPLPP